MATSWLSWTRVLQYSTMPARAAASICMARSRNWPNGGISFPHCSRSFTLDNRFYQDRSAKASRCPPIPLYVIMAFINIVTEAIVATAFRGGSHDYGASSPNSGARLCDLGGGGPASWE